MGLQKACPHLLPREGDQASPLGPAVIQCPQHQLPPGTGQEPSEVGFHPHPLPGSACRLLVQPCHAPLDNGVEGQGCSRG